MVASAVSAALPVISRPQWRSAELAHEVAAADAFAGLEPLQAADRIDPRAFIRVCARRLPPQRTTVVGDAGMVASAVSAALPVISRPQWRSAELAHEVAAADAFAGLEPLQAA
ncbi:hypothetical protein JMF97_30975, partial [Micromonospora fiedleri]|nr:hypothetical protein [Micromonospora fiedleri]